MPLPTAEELIHRARELAPIIGARAVECEELGRMPDQTHQEFLRAGFYRILQPKIHGGYEMDLRVLFDVAKEIARGGCCSSAWVLSIIGIHNYYLAYFHPRAQEDIWGENQDHQTCTPFSPSGQVKPVSGGIEISAGRWSFASGADHAAFALVGVLLEQGAGQPPEFCQCVIPRGDFAIDHDSWRVTGLRGSGSKDITIEHCFVPTHRIFSLTKVLQGIAPGREVNTGPLYRQSFFAPSVCTLVAPACGAALCALDHFEQRLGSRVLSFGAGAQIEKTPSLVRLAEASAEIEAGELLMKKDSQELMDLALAGQTASKQLEGRTMFNSAYALTLFNRAISRLYAASGGGALRVDNPIQRAWRDAQAINSHGGLNFDTNAELYGKIRMGLPTTSALL